MVQGGKEYSHSKYLEWYMKARMMVHRSHLPAREILLAGLQGADSPQLLPIWDLLQHLPKLYTLLGNRKNMPPME